ncbi:MAG: tRNA (N(6)-L-threonylcarbamoyladenosine(37)-C(2))-methylthiotransferase MtaB, partial [Lachnospiraceae bacterium]|nr:tRNA (N(6)-L-threonylcarbamoyladenosine(37)-C(2))-methylthiotransferase MtaB [Lachnospiraceae bacterium]
YLLDLNLYEMHIFQYSKREGTRAATMPHQVPEQIKKERSEKLIKMAKEHTASYIKNLLGEKLTILTEEETEIDGEAFITGFTKEYVKCAFKKKDGIALNETLSGVAKELINDEMILLD